MDKKITLSFNDKVIQQAREYAKSQGISLSRLVEYLLRRVAVKEYQHLEDFPVADWVKEVSEGPIVYKTQKRSRKSTKDEYFSSKK
jgi:antitoxin component of RelBE/YafQ-DinJ toxin-antitoxin module